jgi:acetylornithine deacetylase
MLDPVDLLAQLVAIPSVNPISGGAHSDVCGTERLSEFLERLCGRLGLKTKQQPAGQGQYNVLARLDGDPPPEQGGSILLLDAHQDTVATEGMTVEPFRALLREGRLYGRGACDDKGPMAAMLAAVARLAEERPAPRPTVVLSLTVNEEHGFDGVKALVCCWREGAAPVLPRPPDAAIVGEPTDLQVVVAHKGVIRWQCTARGRAAHSSQPQAGQNAIYRMARVVSAVERYCDEVLPQQAAHRLCGPPTACVSLISGGASVNTVPDRCTSTIECRVPPGSSPE